MYRLIIEDDEGRTTIVPLIRNQINIGREEGNTIRLTERNISRRHAKLAIRDGQIFIEDLKSYNGVWINGKRIDQESPLMTGDLLEIGDYHLSIQEERSAEEQEARPALPPEDDPSKMTPPLGVPAVQQEGAPESEALEPALLLLLNTRDKGFTFDIEQSSLMIGRTEDNDISIDHPSVSRHHAKIVAESGCYKLYDLDSANGVQINGEEFSTCDLRFGDIIELGEVQLRFCSIDTDVEAIVPYEEVFDEEGGEGQGLSINTILVFASILILALGGAIWFFSRGKKKDNKKDPPVVRRQIDKVDPGATQRAALLALQKKQKQELKLAQEFFTQENYVEALSAVDALLKVRPKWKEAIKLKDDCNYEKAQLKRIKASQALQVEGKMFEAYQTLSQIDKDSRYHARASDAKKQIAPKAIEELILKRKEAVAQKRYNMALQYNNGILDIQPKHPEATKTHKVLAKLLKIPIDKRVVPPTRIKDGPKKPAVPAKPDKPKKRVVAKATVEGCTDIIKKGNFATSYDCLDKLIQKPKVNPRAYLLFGDLIAKRGKCTSPKANQLLCLQARHYYNQYLRKVPKGNKDAARIRKLLKAPK